MEGVNTILLETANMDTTGLRTGHGGAVPETYVWEVEGKPISVHLDLDFVDRLLREILTGFGAVPKRGVEVGGILIGSVERNGATTIVRVEDFEPVACRHSRGASYLLSDQEQAQFEDALARWKREDGRQNHAVGFYRSHTRVGLGLTPQDQEMYSRYFPDPDNIVLLVKPFATRVSVGALFFRENGPMRTETSYQEFPFRRSELSGEPAVFREDHGGDQNMSNPMYADAGFPPAATVQPPRAESHGPETSPVGATKGRKNRTGWIWLPLSFIFLLLGVILGFQVALNVRSELPAGLRQDPYTLSLSATPSGDSVHVRWDRSAPAIQASSRGLLIIHDGGSEKTVKLDIGQLKNGSVIYRRASGDLKFRLEVYARDRVSVSESLEYRIQEPAAAR